ncbi:hypothetical protein AURDEDRAFT_185576 [Auricularia subglabra TFB-10046 SS5]|nr:hypothetical protein AURDEDRAFT_185576 [Auricularia subglabra TFB-10046 SS5]
MPRAFAPSRVRVVFALTDMANTARACSLCGVVFPSHRYYAAHVQTPQHRQAAARVQQPREKPKPPDCRVQCRTEQSYKEHLAGRKHAEKLDRKRAHGVHERRKQLVDDTASDAKARGRVFRRRRKARGRWQPMSEEAAMWRQTRRAEQAVLQRWWKRHRGKRGPEFRERRETRWKRRLRRANARVGQAHGWKEERRRKVALAHARPEGKPGAAPVKVKKRDGREVHICAVCGVTYVKQRLYRDHLQSAGHLEALQCIAPPSNLPSWCAICRVHLSLPSWRAYDEHLAGRMHRRNATPQSQNGPVPANAAGGGAPPQPPPAVPMARFLRVHAA